jgi:ribonuclease HI
MATRRLEPIEPFIRPPWYAPRLQFQAEESKDAAKQHHDESLNNSRQNIVFYTDGSGITNEIGAASYCVTTGEIQHQYLGNDSQFNVHAAELAGIHLAIKHWLSQRTPPMTCQIYTDSQAAGVSLSQLKRPPAQSLIKAILDTLDEAPQSQLVKLTWIPGHVDIDGNEKADEEAKRAATDPTLGLPFNHGTLKSARTQQIKQMAQQKWNKEWTNHTKTATLLHHITQTRMSKIGAKYYNNINNRKISTTLAQLRTGHCALNGYLHRFGKAASPYCECGYGKETVQHFLLECQRFKNEWKKLRTEVGTGRMKIAWLLGNKNMASHTMEYIGSTGRLQMR